MFNEMLGWDEFKKPSLTTLSVLIQDTYGDQVT